jgi:hypothetical protein
MVAVQLAQPVKQPSLNHRQAPPAHGPSLMCDGGRCDHLPLTGFGTVRLAGSTEP